MARYKGQFFLLILVIFVSKQKSPGCFLKKTNMLRNAPMKIPCPVETHFDPLESFVTNLTAG